MAEQAHTAGPYAVERHGRQWAVKRPGSGLVFLIRATEVAARKACDAENQRWRDDLIRDAAPDMLAELRRLFVLYGHQATADVIASATSSPSHGSGETKENTNAL